MENRKLDNNIQKIKSLMFEQETKESLASDIKDYLIDKVDGVISSTGLGDAFDSLLGLGDKPQSDSDLKDVLRIPEKSSDEYSKKELKKFYSDINSDDEFYGKVLWGLNIPITTHNLNFMKLWRIAEMGTESSNNKKTATNNPLNTTQPSYADSEQSNYNSVGVKNYSRPEYGVEATIKTLKNGYYDCILDGLRKQIPYEQIADCKTGKSTKPAMDVWGTTAKHMKNVIRSYKGKSVEPKQIDMGQYDNMA